MSAAGLIRRAARRGGNRRVVLIRFRVGTWRGGVADAQVEFRRDIEASVQPLDMDKIEVTPDNLSRLSSLVQVFTTETLLPADKVRGQHQDILEIDGEEYTVEQVQNYRFRSLQHFEAIAARRQTR